jgi:hypothetical protein
MKKPIINFDDFDLPFLSKSIEIEENENSNVSDAEMEDEEEEKQLKPYEIKENMENLIPNSAICIGGMDTEVDNWTSWSNKDEYYIIPLTDDKFDWALFRISWDDNWGRWEWSFDARLIGFKNDYAGAARFILRKLWKKWEIDLKDAENKPYLTLLKNI